MTTKIRRAPRHGARSLDARTIQIVVTPSSGHGAAMTTAEQLRAALAERGRKTSLEVFSDLESLQEWAATDDCPFAALVCGDAATRETHDAGSPSPGVVGCPDVGNRRDLAVGSAGTARE